MVLAHAPCSLGEQAAECYPQAAQANQGSSMFSPPQHSTDHRQPHATLPAPLWCSAASHTPRHSMEMRRSKWLLNDLKTASEPSSCNSLAKQKSGLQQHPESSCFHKHVLPGLGRFHLHDQRKKKKKSNLLKLICSEFFPLRYIFSSETCICFTHFAVSPLAFSSAFLENSKISLFYLHLNYFSTNTAKENDKQRTKHCQTVSVSSHVSTQTLEKLAWK